MSSGVSAARGRSSREGGRRPYLMLQSVGPLRIAMCIVRVPSTITPLSVKRNWRMGPSRVGWTRKAVYRWRSRPMYEVTRPYHRQTRSATDCPQGLRSTYTASANPQKFLGIVEGHSCRRSLDVMVGAGPRRRQGWRREAVDLVKAG
jgi:hypothetical protein